MGKRIEEWASEYPWLAGIVRALLVAAILALFTVAGTSLGIVRLVAIASLLVLLGLAIWYVISRRRASSPVVLRDALPGRNSLDAAGISKRRSWLRGWYREVTRIDAPDGYIQYMKPLPLEEGTVTVWIKLCDDLETGTLLGTSNFRDPHQSNFLLQIATGNILKLAAAET